MADEYPGLNPRIDDAEQQHRACHANGCLHNHRLDDVGQNMTGDNPPIISAQRARRLHKFFFLYRQHLGANQPGIPSGEPVSSSNT